MFGVRIDDKGVSIKLLLRSKIVKQTVTCSSIHRGGETGDSANWFPNARGAGVIRGGNGLELALWLFTGLLPLWYISIRRSQANCGDPGDSHVGVGVVGSSLS